MAAAKTRAKTPKKIETYDESDSTWYSFVEIITSGVKVGVFCMCIYILKEIFLLINDLYFVVENQTIDIIKLELIPAGILLILACCAFWIMSRD